MAFPGKRNKVCSVKVTEEEKEKLIAMSSQLRLPLQELLRRGGLNEGKRLLYRREKKRKAE